MFKIVFSAVFLLLITGCSNSTINLPVGYTLPTMPDETVNSATLEGVDANTNGVRDDVEIFIYTNYSKPEEQKVQMQMAKNTQERFYNVNSKTDGHIWFEKMGDAQDCQEKVFETIEAALKEDNILNSKIVNTVERIKKDLEVRLLMSGEVFPLIHNENPCE